MGDLTWNRIGRTPKGGEPGGSENFERFVRRLNPRGSFYINVNKDSAFGFLFFFLFYSSRKFKVFQRDSSTFPETRFGRRGEAKTIFKKKKQKKTGTKSNPPRRLVDVNNLNLKIAFLDFFFFRKSLRFSQSVKYLGRKSYRIRKQPSDFFHYGSWRIFLIIVRNADFENVYRGSGMKRF